MKATLTVAGLALLLAPGAAHAQHYCGHDVEPSTNNSTTLPNGATIQGFAIWSSGLGDNGVAIMNRHLYCGIIKIYLYTGSNPGSVIEVWPKLDPSIVKHNVAQVGCTATLAQTADAYYFGYSVSRWPFYFTAQVNDQYDDGSNVYARIDAGNEGGVTLQPWTTYTIVANCPPNL